MTDLSTLILALTIVYLAERFRGVVVARSAPVADPEGPEVPEAIVQLSQSYGDEWARDQFIQRAKELYGDFKNWNSVYLALKDSV